MRWEYWIEEMPPDMKEFNEMGEKGWELVSVDNGVAYFKRPLEEIPPAIIVIYTDKSQKAQEIADQINRYLRRPTTTELKTVDTRVEYTPGVGAKR